MSRLLLVGDPHVQPSNIKESEALFTWIADLAVEHKVDRIVLLGDLFHTHLVIRLEVLEFWRKWLPRLADMGAIVMVGNHDMSGDHNSDMHALKIFKQFENPVTIIDKPTVIGNLLFCPYIHDQKKFIDSCNALSGLAKTLFAHQTFDGSMFENGMYAPGGVDPAALDFDEIIGGHVHTHQSFGKVWLPNSARWLTNADANQEKGVWIADFNEAGKRFSSEFFSSEHVCSPIVSFVWKEGDAQPTYSANQRVKIELIGSSDWISKQKKLLTGKVGISSKITDKSKPKNRRTGKSLLDFAETVYESEHKKEVIAYIKENGLV